MRRDIHTEVTTYTHANTTLRGFLALPASEQKAPGVLIAHAWMGQDDFAREKAVALAELGYMALAVDLYGEGKNASSSEEAAALMRPLFLDRALLQGRMRAAYDHLSSNALVDAKKIGAIGFCFGGLAAIELLRSAPSHLNGVVSFHALLGHQLDGQAAKRAPASHAITSKLLILHGHDDPLVSEQDILETQNEMTKAQVDWQMHVYGHTSHAFTNPEAQQPASGLIYNPLVAKRAWQAMCNFFEEIFL